MKESLKKYAGWAITILIVGALVLVMAFCFIRFDALVGVIRNLISILMPVIWGIVIAYVLSSPYNWLRRRLRLLLRNRFHWRGRKAMQWAGILALIGTFVGAGLLIVGLLALIIPQLITSIISMTTALPANLQSMADSLEASLASNPELEENAMSLYTQVVEYVQQWVENWLTPSLQNAFDYVSSGVMSTVTFIKNFLIGIVVAVYLMSGKERFMQQGTRCLYAVFGARWGNLIMGELRYAHQMFTGFIGGKLIDSFCIFLICCVALPIMRMPYAMLISVVIGVTNIIPFFGPFIGAIPSVIIVFISNPFKAIYLAIYILALQQFDGNILGPKILGNSTGLSSFWVLFSILLFGGLFGFVGMIIGVPVFAVIYHIFTALINMALKDKKLPMEDNAYMALDHIDERTLQPVRRYRTSASARKRSKAKKTSTYSAPDPNEKKTEAEKEAPQDAGGQSDKPDLPDQSEEESQ